MGTKTLRWECDVMHRDTVCTHIKVFSDLSVEFENYTDDYLLCAFGRAEAADAEMLLDLFEDRCFSRNRADCREILDMMGLKEYDPLDIVRITHGALVDDFTWIRFPGDTVTWSEICSTWRKGVYRNGENIK